nr:MAG: RNA-dependent RNA polymerase [Chronic bee paralysis virus]
MPLISLSPFVTGARYLMPALTTANITVPAMTMQNLVTSIETRVMAPTPALLPSIAFLEQPRGQYLVAMPNLPQHRQHPANATGLEKFCQRMGWETEIIPEDQFTPEMVHQTPNLIIVKPKTWKSSVDLALTPFASPLSYWRRERTGPSSSTYQYNIPLSQSQSTLPDLLPPKRFKKSQTNSCESHPITSRGADTYFTLSSNGSPDPRDTPLRQCVEEFLTTPQMSWLKRVHSPVDFSIWVKRYPEWRQRQLIAARNRVLSDPEPRRKYALIKNFVKNETTAKFVDPRNISPRSDEFLVVVGPYISAIEHAAVHCPFLIKGLTPKKRCDKLSWLTEYERFLEIDFARFDQTLMKDLLRIVELRFLLDPYTPNPHNDNQNQRANQLFIAFMLYTLTNVGVSRFGTHYKRDGTRCSGDPHTSIGNGFINAFIIWLCLRKLPTNSWQSAHEGDDGIVGLRANVVNQVEYNLKFLSCLGFRAKIRVVSELSQATFCGRRFIETSSGLSDMCDLTRTLGKFNTTMSQGPLDLLLLAKSLSYHHTDANTPMIGALTYALVKTLRPIMQKYSRRAFKRAMALVARERWITNDCFSVRVRNVTVDTPSVPPEAYSGVIINDDLCLRQIQDLESFYHSILDIGFVPNEIPKVNLDWYPESNDVQILGDSTLHHI